MKPINSKPTKFERVYEDETEICTWKYDLEKFPYGPVETITVRKKIDKSKEKTSKFQK